MDAQEIFNTVWFAMKRQNRKSYNHRRGCLYRGPDGAKCAAGYLISDDQYSEDMEGRRFGVADNTEGPTYPKWPEDLLKYETLICRLQECHDSTDSRSEFWPQFSARATRAAFAFGLETPENTQ